MTGVMSEAGNAHSSGVPDMNLQCMVHVVFYYLLSLAVSGQAFDLGCHIMDLFYS